MALIVWPAIKSSYVSDYQAIGGRTLPITLQSGAVHEVQVSTVARYRMTIRYDGLLTNRAAPAPYAAYSEARAIRDLIIALKRGDQAQMVDPIDGVTRTWVLDGDPPMFRRVPRAPWYEAELSLRSVP